MTESRDSTLSSLFLASTIGMACAHTACHSAALVWRALAKLVVKLVSFFLKQNKNQIKIVKNSQKLDFFFFFHYFIIIIIVGFMDIFGF